MKLLMIATAKLCQLPAVPPPLLSLSPLLSSLLLLLLLRNDCRCLCVHVCGWAVCRELCM